MSKDGRAVAVERLRLPDIEGDDLPTLTDFARAGFRRRSDGPAWGLPAWREAIRRYGFAVPCREIVEACASLGPMVEVGAGVAFWAWRIGMAGGDVVATDRSPLPRRTHTSQDGPATWVDVARMNGPDAVRAFPERHVLMIWPSRGSPWAADVLRAMTPGRFVVHVGEIGGCTGDAEFARIIETDAFDCLKPLAIPNWPGMNDEVVVALRTKASIPARIDGA